MLIASFSSLLSHRISKPSQSAFCKAYNRMCDLQPKIMAKIRQRTLLAFGTRYYICTLMVHHSA
jgi:hypothetical protein